MTHPLPFRKHVLATMEKKGHSISKAAELFGIGKESIVRWRERIEPKLTRCKPATKIDMEALARDIEKYPDAYFRERAERLEVSKTGTWYAVQRLGVTRKKKTMRHPKADEDARCAHQEKIEMRKAQGVDIVYFDECGFAFDTPRTHGYAPIGKPCYGTCDWHAKGRTNAIGALLGKSLITVCLFEANITANIFNAWLKQDLLPKLTEKVVVVMDNASFHKRKDT